jgi:hypothetical protein
MKLEHLIAPPNTTLMNAFGAFAHGGGLCDDAPVAAYKFESTTVLLFDVRPRVERSAALESIRSAGLHAVEDQSAFNVLLVPLNCGWSSGREVLGRGIAAVGLHEAIASVAGLPNGWREAQQDLAERALIQLFQGDDLRTATLYGVLESGQREPIIAFLERALLDWETPPEELVYLKAEAGKGKSTAFAELAWRHQGRSDGPLPLLMPLRSVPRGAGVSWGAIAASVGVVGPQSLRLANAVKCGLVCALLDGLDEVAGRYDQTIVSELLVAIRDAVVGPMARVALSGRTTESFAVRETRSHREVALELPDTADAEFVKYVDSVVAAIVPSWPSVSGRVPEPPLEAPIVANVAPSEQERTEAHRELRRPS